MGRHFPGGDIPGVCRADLDGGGEGRLESEKEDGGI